MGIERKNIDIIRSVRRMELKSRAVFSGGFYHEIGPVVQGGSEAVRDPHFNMISVLDSNRLDQHLLTECMGRMIEGVPTFIDVPYPVSGTIGGLLARNGYYPTDQSRSSMLLTERKHPQQATELDIALVEPLAVDIFLELFLRGFSTPEDMIPFAMGMFHDSAIRNCRPESSRLYIGNYHGEPAATLYLFFEGDEGGISMVSTREDLRGKGLATALIQRAIDDSQQIGVRLLGLETQWNGAPERLYRKLGFTTIARHEVFTNVPEMKY